MKNNRPPYWKSTFGFDFDHLPEICTLCCIRLRHFVQIEAPTAEIWRHIHFSRWRPRRLNTTSGFVSVDVTAETSSKVAENHNYHSTAMSARAAVNKYNPISYFCISAALLSHDCTAQRHRRKQATVYVVTACHRLTVQTRIHTIFTARCICISAVFAVTRCPMVCLSRSGVAPKRIKISSKFFHHRVATPF